MSLIDRRLGLLFAAFIALLALVLVRAAWLQAVQGSEYRADARSQQTESVIVPGAMICDARDGATIFVCRGAHKVWPSDPRWTPVTGLWEPYPCANWGPQGRCLVQPNGTGVCN